MTIACDFAGSVVAVNGLDKTGTGDTLLFNGSSAKSYERADIPLPSLTVPQPVFMCSIETYSSKDLRKLDDALKMLMKEDPSLRYNDDSKILIL